MKFKKVIALTLFLVTILFSTPIIPTATSNAAAVCNICGGRLISGQNHSCCDVMGHDWYPYSGHYSNGSYLWKECNNCDAATEKKFYPSTLYSGLSISNTVIKDMVA